MDPITHFFRSIAVLLPYLLAAQVVAAGWLFWKRKGAPTFLMLFGSACHFAGMMTIRIFIRPSDVPEWANSLWAFTVALIYPGALLFTVGFVWFAVAVTRNSTTR